MEPSLWEVDGRNNGQQRTDTLVHSTVPNSSQSAPLGVGMVTGGLFSEMCQILVSVDPTALCAC